MIFFLSCTGNTAWAARHLAEATGERLIDMARSGETKYSLDEGERIGFCFPVHGWRPPFLVREFIQNLNITNAQGHFAYVLCTAGDTLGETLDIAERDLATIGINVNAATSLIMPESYVGLPFMDVDNEQNERRKIAAAQTDLATFTDQIINRKDGRHHIIIGNWPKTNTRLLGHFFLKYLVKDDAFRVDTTKCNQCGKCASACPVSNIKSGHGQSPQWLHSGKCLTCFACYHRCPKKAISYSNRTKGKGQYWFGHRDKNN